MKLSILVSLLLFAGSAMAADIGPAGCGLGNVWFGGTDSQIMAATTNGSTYTQMFGITSGTSNCAEASGVAKLETYVEANKVALANDVARGSGDTLAGLTQVLGCRNQEGVNQVLRANYGDIFSNGSSTEAISNQIRKALKDQPAVGFSCQRLS